MKDWTTKAAEEFVGSAMEGSKARRYDMGGDSEEAVEDLAAIIRKYAPAMPDKETYNAKPSMVLGNGDKVQSGPQSGVAIPTGQPPICGAPIPPLMALDTETGKVSILGNDRAKEWRPVSGPEELACGDVVRIKLSDGGYGGIKGMVVVALTDDGAFFGLSSMAAWRGTRDGRMEVLR